MHFGGMGGGMRVGGMGFAAAASVSRAAALRVRVLRMQGLRITAEFFHHRYRFAFIGVPYAYAAYDSCWRRTWTPYGLQWVNVCGDYGYY